MSASIDMTEILRGLNRFDAAAVSAARTAVDQFGEHVLGDAQEICPVESGALQASATSEPAVMVGLKVSKTIGFNIRYGAARHERPPEKDVGPRQNPRGQWKFLETAVRAAAPKFAPFVAARVKATTAD
ncbi:hypothetical protein [Humisphaera borealis]|uniref:HK97 gp10 family phage protein n=1 Tax=Humisphaera borealis TaxID=2807512 RepID=A0A7M2WZF6_9BACT|nr:hypothetical protein [Humisphaera borealis]QOV90888.1 hypothetical protein IPV69_05880 [Humisphaera borealis]